MGDSVVTPVIVGLAIGIALIVLFSLAYKPSLSFSDVELIGKTKTSEKVQLFLQKYPDAKITVARLELGTEVTYAAEKPVTNLDASQDGSSEKRLIVLVGSTGDASMTMRLDCYQAGNLLTGIDHVTADDINNSCF